MTCSGATLPPTMSALTSSMTWPTLTATSSRSLSSRLPVFLSLQHLCCPCCAGYRVWRCSRLLGPPEQHRPEPAARVAVPMKQPQPGWRASCSSVLPGQGRVSESHSSHNPPATAASSSRGPHVAEEEAPLLQNEDAPEDTAWEALEQARQHLDVAVDEARDPLQDQSPGWVLAGGPHGTGCLRVQIRHPCQEPAAELCSHLPAEALPVPSRTMSTQKLVASHWALCGGG